MAINLTTPFNQNNGTRLIVIRVDPRDEDQEMTVTLQMRSSVASGDNVVSEATIVIRNGVSDRVSRATLSAGQPYSMALVPESRVLSTATGFTDAMAAWKGGSNNTGRKAALETQMLSAGTIHSSLTGT